MGQHDEEARQDAQKIYPGDVTASGIQWLVGTHGGGGISAARHRRRRSETIPISPAYSIIKWKRDFPLPKNEQTVSTALKQRHKVCMQPMLPCSNPVGNRFLPGFPRKNHDEPAFRRKRSGVFPPFSRSSSFPLFPVGTGKNLSLRLPPFFKNNAAVIRYPLPFSVPVLRSFHPAGGNNPSG
ncbi:hypothetical protein HMPREF1326_01762 [Akkermansia sp. KLE1605]|nr:hypothetical protein HMPREF1326_01762 [Akkermansia sp. KLE1605]